MLYLRNERPKKGNTKDLIFVKNIKNKFKIFPVLRQVIEKFLRGELNPYTNHQ